MFVSAPADAVTINEFTISTYDSQPFFITRGPDGNLWFAEEFGDNIGRITTSGVITEFTIPTVGSFSRGITAGPDGNLWFTELAGTKIGRITTSGVITEFTVPTANSQPQIIKAGPDGNLWFNEYYGNKIGQITTSGVITEFTIPTTGSQPWSITAGPDGNLWFTEYHANQIGRITTSGVITEFTIPTSDSQPADIVAGPDGNLWFTEDLGNQIGRITTSGVITEFTVPTPVSGPDDITVGPDGNLWFTEYFGTRIGQITTAGVITEFTIPLSGSQPWSITAGQDGNLWYTDIGVNKIEEIVLATVPKSNPTLSVSNAGTGSGTVTSSPSGISCGSNCSASYSSGTSVTLRATANPGNTFTGWSGACSGQNASATCVVTMSTAQAVAAHYIITGIPSFNDVTSASTFESYIQAIYNNGITVGCGNGDYCPSEDVTRDQMASFIIRAIYGQNFDLLTTTPYTSTPYFSDVLPTDYFFRYIQKLKDLDITQVSGSYSPGEDVTRDQMAAFIIRALYGGNTPICSGGVACSAKTPYFSDVLPTDPSEAVFFPYIQKLYELGITVGCNNGQSPLLYCPSEDVTRDQMAAFLSRAFLGMK